MTSSEHHRTAAERDHHEALAHSLRLSLIPGVGPRLRQSLLDHFGSVDAVFEAPSEALRRVPGVGPKTAKAIARALDEIDVEAEIEHCRQLGISLVARASDAYPSWLREIPDPPEVLFVRGQLEPRDRMAVAVVGTRHASPYGVQQARRLAGQLARCGLTIVSGLARGIDAAAHRSAIEAGGRTLAVLAGGLERIYPPEHAGLADEVTAAGALLSEMPPRFRPLAGMFPQRNRLISGLSLGVVVVEAATRSGALITARHACEQGREVFAVPGRVDSRTSRGCHRLLRDGAKLVETVDDILEEIAPMIESPASGEPALRSPAELNLNPVERSVLEAIDHEPTPIDSLVGATGLSMPRVLAAVSALEIRRLVRRMSGQWVARTR